MCNPIFIPGLSGSLLVKNSPFSSGNNFNVSSSTIISKRVASLKMLSFPLYPLPYNILQESVAYYYLHFDEEEIGSKISAFVWFHS